MHPIDRRSALALVSATTAALGLCPSALARPRGDESVILYSSADDFLLRQVVEAFEKLSGIRVKTVGDTEATKNTGLVNRLLAEKDRPKADVWWSSEVLGTIRLMREGLLQAYVPDHITAIPGGWPSAMKAADDSWHGFAARARVIAYHTKHLRSPHSQGTPNAPNTLRGLAREDLKGRIGMARPQFGTTGAQMAFIAVAHGEAGLRSWLTALKDNGLRLYDSNSSVVRGISQGEIWAGLTDTDDVHAAARNDWPVSMAVDEVDELDERAALKPGELPSVGPLLLPNSVALIKGGPNTEAGQSLIDFLLSEECERLIAGSESRNLPIRPGVAEDFPELTVHQPATCDYNALADAYPGAIKICSEILG